MFSVNICYNSNMFRYFTALFCIISFVTVAVFGFVIFGNCANGGVGCVASFVQGLACPAASGEWLLDFVHAQTFHGFSLALLSSYLIIASLLILFLFFSRPAFGMSGEFLFFRRRALDGKTFPIRDFLLSWLSYREKRDPSICL